MELYEEGNDGGLVSYDTSVPAQTEQPTYSADFIKGAAEGAEKFIDTVGQFSSGAQKGLVDMLDLVGGYSNQEAADMKAAIDLEGGVPQTFLEKTLNFAGQLVGPDILMGGVASELKGLGIATKSLGALDKVGIMLEGLPAGERLLPALYSASEKAQRTFPTGAKIVDSLRKLPETVASFGASGFSEKAKDFVKTAPEVLFESARPWQEVYKDMSKVFSERIKAAGNKIEEYENVIRTNFPYAMVSRAEILQTLKESLKELPKEAARDLVRPIERTISKVVDGSKTFYSKWSIKDLRDELEAYPAFRNLYKNTSHGLSPVEAKALNALESIKGLEKEAFNRTKSLVQKTGGGAEEALLSDYIKTSEELDKVKDAFTGFEEGISEYAGVKQFQRDIGAKKGVNPQTFGSAFRQSFSTNKEGMFDAFQTFLPENLFKEGASKVINMSDDALETSLELGAGLRRGWVDAGKSILAKTAVAPFSPKPAYNTTLASDLTKGVGAVLTSPLRLASKPGVVSVGLNNLLSPSE